MLTSLQERVARIVAALPEADGFALAGGAAVIIHGIVDRGTDAAWPPAVRRGPHAAVRLVELTAERMPTDSDADRNRLG